MVKANDVVYKYYEVEFAVKHKKDGFKASSIEVLIGYDFHRRKQPSDFLIIAVHIHNKNFNIVSFFAAVTHKIRDKIGLFARRKDVCYFVIF